MGNENYSPASGKQYKSDGSIVNVADSFSKTFKSIISQTTVINQIKEGEIFFLRDVFENVSDTTTNYLVFETGSKDVWLFAAIIGGVEGQIDVEYRKNADVNSDGTSITLGNRNDQSANTSSLTSQINPTVNNEGDLISKQKPGAAGGTSKRIGAETGAENPFLLDNTTTYLIKITNISGGAQDINYFLEMLENNIVD